jgi:hypothetical protein
VPSALYSQIEISTPISDPQGRSESLSRGFPFSKSYLFRSTKSDQKSLTVMMREEILLNEFIDYGTQKSARLVGMGEH